MIAYPRNCSRMKILVVIGTRPEAIKMAPIVKMLRLRSEVFDSRVCVTAQHRQMLDEVFTVFGIQADYDLDVMVPGQSPSQVCGRVFMQLDPVVEIEQPDWVLVQGDTTSAMVASLVAYYRAVKIGHVEAGLRTYNKREPFPEEMNRRITGLLADMHWAPTETARANLLREGVGEDQIRVTGNPVIDALLEGLRQPCDLDVILPHDVRGKRILLVTAHRRENFGAPIQSICDGLARIADRFAERLRQYDLDAAMACAEQAEPIAAALTRSGFLDNPGKADLKSRIQSLYRELTLMLASQQQEVSGKLDQIRDGLKTLGAYGGK